MLRQPAAFRGIQENSIENDYFECIRYTYDLFSIIYTSSISDLSVSVCFLKNKGDVRGINPVYVASS